MIILGIEDLINMIKEQGDDIYIKEYSEDFTDVCVDGCIDFNRLAGDINKYFEERR